ncbi:MAG: GNAT family N-acetyltransferase [Clostridia bacterium]|nr:GNAT family N-acetyltransferase [Clostridia bacterium]
MSELFECFPYIQNEHLIIKKMTEDDLDALEEMTSNANLYRYVPPFLYKKSRGNLLAAIRNLGGREFDKKRKIMVGVYLSEEPNRLIGLVQMFDYKKRSNQMTIGYSLNELYWNRGIATEAARLIVNYLCNDMSVKTLKAYVMPENVYSQRILIKIGFIEEANTVQGENWGGKDVSDLKVYTYKAL